MNEKQWDEINRNGFIGLARRFLQWMQTRGYSPKTIHSQRETLYRFIQWCQERGVACPCEVSKGMIERYQTHLYHRQIRRSEQILSAGRRKNLLIAVSSFFAWLAKAGHILYNPASEIELPKVPKRLPRNVLTPEEAEFVLQKPDTVIPLGIRDRAILETLYSTGIRRLECTKLTVEDIHFDEGVAMVSGKGKKDRVVPIGKRALLWIDKYLAEVRPVLLDKTEMRHSTEKEVRMSNILFLNQYGKPYNADGLSSVVTKYVRAANIDKTGSCHILRHSMATSMLENGADIRYIQQILGHSELSTTAIYTKVSIAKLKEVHAKTHPAQMKSDGTSQQPTN